MVQRDSIVLVFARTCQIQAGQVGVAGGPAYTLSLLDLRASPGADGDVTNVHDVVGDHCFC